MPEHEELSTLAGTSVARHLIRGGVGFGLLGTALALLPTLSLAALLLASLGMVALRGCPTCWLAGLVQTISAKRLERSCMGTDCALRSRRP